MRFSNTHKNKTTKANLFVVADVKAQQLKNLKIPYKIYHNGYNYEFIIQKEYIPLLIHLVEPQHKEYWQEKINKVMGLKK